MSAIVNTQSNKSSKNMSKTFVEKNEHFNTNCDDANGISICIPRMFNNIGFRRVKGVFIKQNWGFVERVDVIHYGDHKKAFVHFRPNSWNWTKRNQQILQKSYLLLVSILDHFDLSTQKTFVVDFLWMCKVHPRSERHKIRLFLLPPTIL